MRIAYLTDVEGRWDKLASFADGNPDVSLVDGALRLADGVAFVFGGDAIDRGAHGRRIVSLLLAATREYGDRVVLLSGNRDINKLRLVTELGGSPRHGAPVGCTRAELLRWTLARTMGAAKAFEHRIAELSETGQPSDDDAVVDSFLADLAAGGELRAYLNACRLGFRAGSTLFLHGGVTSENFLATPGVERARDIDGWLVALDRFYRGELAAFDRGSRPDALIAYQAQDPVTHLNQGSVVYARPTDADGNPHLPPVSVVERLVGDGIRRIVVGHTPSGDCPAIVRGGGLELVLADNSYGRIERGSQLAFTDETTEVRATTLLDDGSRCAVRCAVDRDTGPPLGRRLVDTGRLVKAQLATGDYVLFRGLPEYAVEQTAMSSHELATLVLECPYE